MTFLKNVFISFQQPSKVEAGISQIETVFARKIAIPFTFFLKHEIDTGEVIQQVKVPIADTDNVEIVYDKLMMLGGDLVLETVDAILNGTVMSIPQEEMFASEAELRPAPKIFKETCRIDWNKGVKGVYDHVRGLSPYPAAWTELCVPEGSRQVLKIYETEKQFVEHTLPVGMVDTDGKTYFRIAVKDGYVNLLSIQLAGKKRMSVGDFLRGYRHVEKTLVEWFDCICKLNSPMW